LLRRKEEGGIAVLVLPESKSLGETGKGKSDNGNTIAKKK